MKKLYAIVPAVLFLAACGSLWAAEGALLDSMDELTFKPTSDKGTVELVEGKVGKAIKFNSADGCSGLFFLGRAKGAPEWDNAAGFSFWVKGDGSDHLGGLQFVWKEDYAVRYTLAFPIDSTEWKKIVVAWRDLIPVLPNANMKPLDPKGDNKPSQLGQIWFGKWWFWKDYAAHSYAIDEIRLEPAIDLDNTDYKPAGAPLARVQAKLKAKQPVTIVTMGDSLTDFGHWANKDVNWPTLLKKSIKEKYGVDATIVNPAIGGTQLADGEVIIPRWLKQAPQPDLVTVLYGFNDHDSGMTGPLFLNVQKDTVERVRRATKGAADVLIMTTCPAVSKWDTMADLAESCRKAAAEENAGLCDTYAAFHEAGKDNKEKFYVNDHTHMGPEGHALIAKAILESIEKGGK